MLYGALPKSSKNPRCNSDSRNLYIKRNVQPRKYGKRLEFKPPMTQKLQRKCPPVGGNLDKSKSHSTTELPRMSNNTKVANKAKSLVNARRLYRIVKPLAPSRFTSVDDREKCVGPEFVVRSSQPIVQLDIAHGKNLF